MDCRENTTPWPEDTDFDEKRMIVTFWLHDDDGGDVEYKREFEWVVCDVCRGRGTHVNPSIDADHGITQEEFDDDPEFRDDYFSGVYDVTCYQCQGKRVAPELKNPCPELDAYREDEYDYRQMCAAERRMGA